jgi:hypothetical protein
LKSKSPLTADNFNEFETKSLISTAAALRVQPQVAARRTFLKADTLFERATPPFGQFRPGDLAEIQQSGFAGR